MNPIREIAGGGDVQIRFQKGRLVVQVSILLVLLAILYFLRLYLDQHNDDRYVTREIYQRDTADMKENQAETRAELNSIHDDIKKLLWDRGYSSMPEPQPKTRP